MDCLYQRGLDGGVRGKKSKRSVPYGTGDDTGRNAPDSVEEQGVGRSRVREKSQYGSDVGLFELLSLGFHRNCQVEGVGTHRRTGF